MGAATYLSFVQQMEGAATKRLACYVSTSCWHLGTSGRVQVALSPIAHTSNVFQLTATAGIPHRDKDILLLAGMSINALVNNPSLLEPVS